MSQHSPKIDLTQLLLSISSAAFMGLGMTPEGQKDETVNLELARQNIDLLELIHEKTRGNRTPDEDILAEKLLFEVRLRFVETQRRLKG